jgi:transforming growth factor-beta-induced protein
MKNLRINLSLLLAAALFATACNNDDDPQVEEPTQNVVEIAQSNESFSTLVTALSEADLVTALNGNGPFTVFAPTNDAFNALLSQTGLTVEELLQSELLDDVLLYHVVSGKILSTDLSNTSVETLSGETINISIDGGVTINGSASVTTADIEATNGVIHIIDQVLVPENLILNPTIVEIAVANESFSILVQALSTANLVDALSGDGPFTVFAPTDAAFADLLAELDVTAEQLLAREDLADILLYHVVSGSVFSTDLTNGDVPTLLTNASVAISIEGGVSINDRATVTTADVKAKNGVIHIIDKVLLPTN